MSFVLAIAVYVAIGYVVGVPLGVAGDWILGRTKDETSPPLSWLSAILVWPFVLLIVIAAFPAWLRDFSESRRSRSL